MSEVSCESSLPDSQPLSLPCSELQKDVGEQTYARFNNSKREADLVAIPTQGFHGPVRARIGASDSSNHGFAAFLNSERIARERTVMRLSRSRFSVLELPNSL